jgi:uncharacterized protein YuzE
MTLHYYPETDSLYIELSEAESVESREISPGLVLDFDAQGHLIGLDIDHASRYVNLTKIEATSLPLKILAVA